MREEAAGEANCRRLGSESWVEAAGRTVRGRRRLDLRGALARRQLRSATRAAEERRESMVASMRPACGYGSILHVSQAELEWGGGLVVPLVRLRWSCGVSLLCGRAQAGERQSLRVECRGEWSDGEGRKRVCEFREP